MLKYNIKEGMILVNKPKGITSHDVVDIVRQRLRMRRVGHAGTLDPLAEGLLIILVGNYTKLFPKFVNLDKEYAGVLKLGEITTSGDSEGELIEQYDYRGINEEKIRRTFSLFRGNLQQIPPMLSARRIRGERLYNLARRGIAVERPSRQITIHSLEIVNIDLPYVEFYTHCSKGTYIRKLAEDIGQKLSCGAHMVKIVRIGIGPFKLKDAVVPVDIDESHLQKVTF